MYKYYSNNRYFKQEINDYFSDNGWTVLNNTKNKDIYYDVDYFDKICSDCQIVNQLKDINYLGNKKLQYDNLISYLKYKPDYVPTTISFEKKNISKIKNNFKNKLYILKPENDSFRNGVQVVSNYDQAQNWIINSNYNKWIIQDYISNPLLFNNRKFHLRIYAILLIDKFKFTTYVYHYGFMYSAKNKYTLISNSDAALSGEDSEEQVNLFPEDFINYYSYTKYIHIKKQINKIISDTILAASDKLKCPNTNNSKYKCFKLLGYDLLIDENYKMHLLEINARFITFKYPPANYKKKMYYSILDLILKNNSTNFDKVNQIEFENFENNKDNIKNNRDNIKQSNYCYLILVLIILIIIICIYRKINK